MKPPINFGDDTTLVSYALTSYSFVLSGDARTPNPAVTATLADLADAICRSYSQENPRNRAVVAALRRHPSVRIYVIPGDTYWYVRTGFRELLTRWMASYGHTKLNLRQCRRLRRAWRGGYTI